MTQTNKRIIASEPDHGGAAVIVSSSARTPDELAGTLADVSAALGLPARNGGRVLLESGAPPFQVIMNVFEVLDAIRTTVEGGQLCARLYKSLRKRFPYRKVSVLFEVRPPKERGIRYSVTSETPNEAIAMIPDDCAREVRGNGSWRWWVEEGWMTYEEYEGCARATRGTKVD